MPKNNNLEPVKLPMEQKWNKVPETEFINNLDAIKVELIDAPSIEQLMNYITPFVNATWDEPDKKYTIKEKAEAVYNALHFKTLPTALETIGLTFRISGISMQEVTHIIRYRKASFSAECSGDKWWTDKKALIPNSVENSNGDGFRAGGQIPRENNFHARYIELVEECKKLYQDMIDSKQISIMDARYILPRCMETFYYMRMNLADAVHFIRQRIDKQIQPETDNVIAYQMYIEILKKIPFAFGLVNIHAPSAFYISTARTGRATNLYFPDEDSDKFDWNEKDFIYQHYRYEMNGTDEGATNKFLVELEKYEKQITELEKEGSELYADYLRRNG